MSAAAVGAAKYQNHQELFLERYSRLLKWATQLTKHDHELAKDLVQDAFISFTLSAGDLLAIGNIDNYLYGVLRNAYLSHLRRSIRQPSEQFVDQDFDSDLLLADDPRPRMQVKDKLRAICYHACIRKDSSITGSILILRFFHGYSPTELAKLIHSSRNIVDVQLRSARAEAIACLVTPSRLNSPRQELAPSRNRTKYGSDLILELREQIFSARKGRCLSPADLLKIYRTDKAMSRATLSHLVSCPDCLDQANRLLGLPLLRERHVIDVLGRTSETDRNDALGHLIRFCLSLVSSWPMTLLLYASLA